MFDADTVALIAQAPALEGLDLTRLPQDFTEVYAEVVTARIRLRQIASVALLPDAVRNSIKTMRRLASAQEAFVSTLPGREDRASAAFVAASAHHVCMLADAVVAPEVPRASYLGIDSVSPEISAVLLFLVAEASADAAETAKRIRATDAGPIEARLLNAISDLAMGRLGAIVSGALPSTGDLAQTEPGLAATRALYFMLLRGVRALAQQMLGTSSEVGGSAADIFASVIALAAERLDGIAPAGDEAPYNIFSGPLHLAALLQAVARDFPASALVEVFPPGGISSSKWRTLMKQMARQRPYVWRNHREAIGAGYLETGISAAVSFPTGGGKSRLAELKIAAALLRGVKVIFLAPTLALVDQTATALAKTFPQAQVQRERPEEMVFSQIENEPLPGISVLTPERCLTMLSFTSELFQDVGLIVFDECHLLHPRNMDTSRRSIDAMLCLLNLNRLAPTADILLLSAMMKNAAEMAGWLEELTDRRCLGLGLKWKPTRQVRGCVVYASERLSELQNMLTETRKAVTNKNTPVALKRSLTAQPFGFFCLRQTWVSKARIDYALLPLLEDRVTLSTGTRQNGNWYLTPNGNQVSAAIGAATGRQGLKTLIFAQTIPLCKSTCDAINKPSDTQALRLTDEERALYRVAVEEAGGAEHLYLTMTAEGLLADASACHHGLLILQERQLHEALFRRPDGVNILVATSTLAQGMNLPSEVVLIAGDSRFDPNANRMERLEAHELLNAAGRAGRAGEVSQGFVLIVPSKVVDFQSSTNQIHRHWSDLQAIFSQSDQCLEIDDPFTALLDQVHARTEPLSSAARYLLSRLPQGNVSDPGGADASANELLSRSFGAYRARIQGNTQWLATRIAAAIQLRNADPDITNSWIDQIAASSGIPARILTKLTQSLLATASGTPPTTAGWRAWMLAWLRANAGDIPQLIRQESLEGIFGSSYKKLDNDIDKGLHVILAFERLLPAWMTGATLAELEHIAGAAPDRLGKCETAREFVLRIVPELGYLYGILPQLYATLFPMEPVVPIALATLGAAVREGVDQPEKVALRQVRSRNINRIAVHREYQDIAVYLSPGGLAEAFSDVMDRVRSASDLHDFLKS
ncbi:MAG: DEAD/DEAH box helicase [Bradyrhizobium sp.]|nr:DEAD/DEAH box helicase [Bradyrhizobium sp.]